MKFEFSGSLLRYVGYSRSLVCETSTLKAGFEELRQRYPQLKSILFATDDRVSAAHQVFINGVRVPPAQLADAAVLERNLAQDDTVSILTLITGG